MCPLSSRSPGRTATCTCDHTPFCREANWRRKDRCRSLKGWRRNEGVQRTTTVTFCTHAIQKTHAELCSCEVCYIVRCLGRCRPSSPRRSLSRARSRCSSLERDCRGALASRPRQSNWRPSRWRFKVGGRPLWCSKFSFTWSCHLRDLPDPASSRVPAEWLSLDQACPSVRPSSPGSYQSTTTIHSDSLAIFDGITTCSGTGTKWARSTVSTSPTWCRRCLFPAWYHIVWSGRLTHRIPSRTTLWKQTTAQTSPPCLHATSTIHQTRIVFRHRCNAQATMVLGSHDRSATLRLGFALKCSTDQQNEERAAQYKEKLAARTQWDTWARTCDACVSNVTETQRDETDLLLRCCKRPCESWAAQASCVWLDSKSRANKSKRPDIADLSQRARVNVTRTELFAHGRQDSACGTFHRWSAQCDGRQIRSRETHQEAELQMLCAERANVSTNVAHESNGNSALQVETSSCQAPLQSPHLHHHVMHMLTDIAKHFDTFKKDRRTLRTRVFQKENLLFRTHTHIWRKHDPRKCTFFWQKIGLRPLRPKLNTVCMLDAQRLVFAYECRCGCVGVSVRAPFYQEEPQRARGVAFCCRQAKWKGKDRCGQFKRARDTIARGNADEQRK